MKTLLKRAEAKDVRSRTKVAALKNRDGAVRPFIHGAYASSSTW